MVAGEVPKFTEEGYNNQVILSDKIANDLHLKPKDSIVAIFLKKTNNPFIENLKFLEFTRQTSK